MIGSRIPGPSAAWLLAVLTRVRHGRLELVAPSGEHQLFAGDRAGPAARIELHDWSVCAHIMRTGEIGFVEGWLAGRWSTPDLTALLTLLRVNYAALAPALQGSWRGRLARLLAPLRRTDSGRNIHARYDLSNDFYARWLDRSMTYSGALFDGDPARTLEQAQRAKYERILERLDPKPWETMLDIGCGWGGFAQYAARTRRCRVHAVTISRRQLDYARSRIARTGLADRIKLGFMDYRDLCGQYDHVVSIEMYETIGERWLPRYFETLAQCLRPGRRAMIQAITLDAALLERYRRSTDFIRRYISPHGLLASLSDLCRQATRAGLQVRSTDRFGEDYAETLKRWHQRFDRAWPELSRLGLDERFRRLWSYYLSYCEAGFRAGATDVYQMELAA